MTEKDGDAEEGDAAPAGSSAVVRKITLKSSPFQQAFTRSSLSFHIYIFKANPKIFQNIFQKHIITFSNTGILNFSFRGKLQKITRLKFYFRFRLKMRAS